MQLKADGIQAKGGLSHLLCVNDTVRSAWV